MVNGTEQDSAVTIWSLNLPSARALARDAARFEDLQSVLQCCERLLAELGGPAANEPGVAAVVDALWSTTLAAYQRCFAEGEAGTPLTEQDVLDAHPDHPEVKNWHQALLALRSLDEAAAAAAPEPFAVGVVRDDAGEAAGVAITAGARPRPDEVTVRSAGTIAYALSGVVDKRLVDQQAALLLDVQTRPASELDALPHWEAAAAG